MTVWSKIEMSVLPKLLNNKSGSVKDIFNPRWSYSGKTLGNDAKNIHQTAPTNYPPIRPLPLPNNVEDISGSANARFSPLRTRDINGSLISGDKCQQSADARIFSYDCNGSVSLSSAMQSNVPQPCAEQGFYTHFNMPGGLWRQGEKYVASDFLMSSMLVRNYCTKKQVEEDKTINIINTPPLTRKEKLKRAVKEYGSVVIVFHISISLVSLGVSYLAVTSGLDFSTLLDKWQPTDGSVAATTAAPFVVAYAIHKVFAPVRISITLISVPFIVKYLRRINILKAPKPSNN